MKTKKLLSVLLATAMFAAMLTGCGKDAKEPTDSNTENQSDASNSDKEDPNPDGTGEAAEGGLKQAPMLDELVADGTIPALEERIPKETVTLTPKNEVGAYGDTFYGAFPSAYMYQGFETLGFFEPLLIWNDDRTELIPNVLSKFETNEDATVFTLTLREGLKWSNGDPVTTEDIRYCVEDVWGNPSLYSETPVQYTAGGESLKLEVVDEYTCKLTFAVSNPTFQYSICQQGITDIILRPSNYLKQFNDKYTDEAELAALAESKGYDTWVAMYSELSAFQKNAELPTLYAWKNVSISEDGLIHGYERNPYYFKFDTAQNQLPYMDKVQVEFVENQETLNLKIMSGEVDYIYAPVGESMVNYPLFAQNAEAGNYHIVLAGDEFAHKLLVLPNSSSQDPQKGPLLSDKNFRIALSQAINREEMVSLFGTVGDFKAEIAQQSPISESPYYNETLATQYTEYDVDKANQLLDEIGLTERGSDGYRLGLDGNSLVFQFSIPTFSDEWVDIGMRLADYWKAVGINVEVKAISPEMWNELSTSNQLEITALSSGSGGMLAATTQHLDAYSLAIVGWDERWGTAWAQYYTSNGEIGIEPPEYVKELNALHDEILSTADYDQQKAKIEEYLNKYAEIFPSIGIMRQLPQFIVINNNLGNTPEDGEAIVAFSYGVGGNVNPCQFYKK